MAAFDEIFPKRKRQYPFVYVAGVFGVQPNTLLNWCEKAQVKPHYKNPNKRFLYRAGIYKIYMRVFSKMARCHQQWKETKTRRAKLREEKFQRILNGEITPKKQKKKRR
jgi:hypothetical protein